MATSPATIDAVLDQVRQAGTVTTLRMFGEYCLYLDGKPVGLICQDRLYVKPTDAGQTLVPTVATGSPFPGCRPYLLIPEDWLDGWTHRETLCELLRVTSDALPAPKPKRRVVR